MTFLGVILPQAIKCETKLHKRVYIKILLFVFLVEDILVLMNKKLGENLCI